MIRHIHRTFGAPQIWWVMLRYSQTQTENFHHVTTIKTACSCIAPWDTIPHRKQVKMAASGQTSRRRTAPPPHPSGPYPLPHPENYLNLTLSDNRLQKSNSPLSSWCNIGMFGLDREYPLDESVAMSCCRALLSCLPAPSLSLVQDRLSSGMS